MDLSDSRPVPRVEESRSGLELERDSEAWGRSPSLSRRFVVGSLVAFAILVVNAFVSYRTIANLIDSNRTVESTLNAVRTLKDVQDSVTNSETELRGYIISSERDRLIRAQEFLGSAANHVQALRSLSEAIPDQSLQVEALDVLIGEEIDRFAKLIEVHRRKGVPAAIQAIRATASTASIRRIQDITGDLLAAGDARLGRRTEQSKQGSDVSVITAVIATLLNLVLLGLVILLARREIKERRQAEEVVRFAAMHDPLTGLPNRLLLADRANRALATAKS